MRLSTKSNGGQRFGGWPPNSCEEEGERFSGEIPLYHVVEFEWLRRSDVVQVVPFAGERSLTG
jgi:hypothetical protein